MPPPSESPSPLPTAFTYLSGNFDFPPATTTTTAGEREELPHEERSSSPQERRAFPPHVIRRRYPRPQTSSGGPRRAPRPPHSLREPREPREPRDISLAPPVPPSTTNRPRASPTNRYLRRSNARLSDRPTIMDSTAGFMESLSEGPPRMRSPANGLDTPPRQTKRRKLEGTPELSPWDGYKYGHEGQVVSTRLKMELVSYDGGEYDKHTEYGQYSVQNVLRNDRSVYCSERSRCNLLLKHIGEMPFTLEKIEIRAPDRNFTAPVQEGLIFVSMTADDILERTSAYNIEYESPSPPRQSSQSSAGDQLLSLREAILDPYVWDNSRQPASTVEDELQRLGLQSQRHQVENSVRADRRMLAGLARRRREALNDISHDCDDAEDDEETYVGAAGVSAPTPPPFTVHTENDEDSDEDEVPSATAERLRRESRWQTESDEDSDYLYDFPTHRRSQRRDATESLTQQHLRNYASRRAAGHRRETPSRIELTQEAGPSDSEPPLAPHAKFFIAPEKSKIVIKFHPALSGKFVLLKLWSPSREGNIDIQSVNFFGYSGPRFFPAVQPC